MKILTKTTSLLAVVLFITGTICLTACRDKQSVEEPVAITLTVVSDNETNQYNTFTGKYLSTVLSENNVEINDYNSIGFYLDENFITPFENHSVLTQNTIVYTKMATLDKITINSSYGVKAKNTSISGEVVLPRCIKYFDQSFTEHDGFEGCSQMTSIVISSKLKNEKDWGYPIFYNCAKLTNITVVGDNEDFSSENGILFTKNKTKLLKYPQGKKSITYTVPQGTQEIGFRAFSQCSDLITIVLQEGVKVLGQEAFDNCSKLISIQLPNSLEECRSWGTFSNCSKLSSITIPSNLHFYALLMFGGCDALREIAVDSMHIAERIDDFLDGVSLEDSTTNIYIKTGLNIVRDSSNADSFINNFTKQSTSDKVGYDMYVRNS